MNTAADADERRHPARRAARASAGARPAGLTAVRVLVAFKVTPDLEALRDADWAAATERGVETRYVRRILNCFDESALELVLRAADGLAGMELGAVSIGGREVEPYVKTLRALGYERATRIDPGAAQTEHGASQTEHGAHDTATDLDFAPGVVASLIARYARDIDRSDLVVLGSTSGPGDGGTVPFRVAEEMGWPCLSQVTELEPLADGRLRATCVTDVGSCGSRRGVRACSPSATPSSRTCAHRPSRNGSRNAARRRA